jgi:hypothetical protein
MPALSDDAAGIDARGFLASAAIEAAVPVGEEVAPALAGPASNSHFEKAS